MADRPTDSRRVKQLIQLAKANGLSELTVDGVSFRFAPSTVSAELSDETAETPEPFAGQAMPAQAMALLESARRLWGDVPPDVLAAVQDAKARLDSHNKAS